MNIQQLEYIIAVDRYKSFSKAADACFITQATLSTMVKKLEEELDIIIFDRKKVPVVTTDSGREIIAQAIKATEFTQRIKEMAAHLSDKIEGEVNIGVIPTISGNLLPRILPELLLKYPKLQFYFQELTTHTIIQNIKNGSLDMGIISTPVETSDLITEVLYYEHLLVYGNIDKPDQLLIPEDIMNHQVWLLQEGHCLRDQIIHLCDLEPRNIKENLTFYPNTFDSLLNLTDTFGGLTLIPQLYYVDLPAERKKKVFRFKDPQPLREVSLVYQRPYVKQNISRMLVNEIKKNINYMNNIG